MYSVEPLVQLPLYLMLFKFIIETIVEIVGLVVKICTMPTNGILAGTLTKSKTEVLIEVSKIEVAKIVLTIEEHKMVEYTISITIDANSVAEGCYNLVDEVVDTSISDVLSYEGEKSDWTFNVSMVVTIKPIEAIFELDDVASFVGE